ncbi:hypothetical protein B0H16DRAFT_1623424 [Mycena metata]|uniref:Uncharacterized protein n=1 Tax=Mycena metata TaxID=1033252 RepID=A0AAD7H6Q4_9AGAR|nr:hypothetical protein B0H16DRAFT_1623424 [Mycena metata]
MPPWIAACSSYAVCASWWTVVFGSCYAPRRAFLVASLARVISAPNSFVTRPTSLAHLYALFVLNLMECTFPSFSSPSHPYTLPTNTPCRNPLGGG